MTRLATFVAAIAFFLLPCITVSAQHEAEVIHWWVSGGERAALQTLIDTFQENGNKWIDTPVESSYYAKTAAISRILDGKPPTAVQWQAGVSLKELYSEGLFRNINELARKEQWRDVLPEAIWDGITVDGNIIAVPMTLHSSNWIWANKKILDEVGIGIPKNWDDFLQYAPRIREAGYYPLALGGQPWQERALFLPVVLGVGGAKLYEDALVHHKPEALQSPGMKKAFETFRSLQQFIDPESPDRNWSDTTKLVIEGKAAFQIMGDWAKGEFFQAGMEPDKDFICAFSPGSEGAFIMVSDTFAMGNVTDEAMQQAQEKLAMTIMKKEVQSSFNLLKGSIPPRLDAPVTGFDKCARLAMTTVAVKGSTYPGFNMANNGIIASAIMSVITKFWNTRDLSPDEATRMLAEAVEKSKL
ncbi:ABC transporter substrate-binding protein [Desulfopila sp. IMCC35008]|uniref:ABC transporter substrate-binding protein n=1 Tax=Desulfopila sp. IMCC35008 TaxID=2653858 RepID=UPI0013CFAB55|nr:ABC transporter substrate-binding protein [Desulfopila sp. IMCC35008]